MLGGVGGGAPVVDIGGVAASECTATDHFSCDVLIVFIARGDVNFDFQISNLSKSLQRLPVWHTILPKVKVKVEERTEPPAAPAETSTVRWSLGEKVAREERLNRLTQLRFLQVDKHEGYREEGRLVGLWMEEPEGGGEELKWMGEREMIKDLGNNRTFFSHSFQLWLIRSKFRKL